MGDKQDGTPKLSEAGAAAPVPSRDGAVRHTFMLRLVPKFRDDPSKPPLWHGKLEHSSRGQKSDVQSFNSVNAMLTALKRMALRITGEGK
jgi:hypothetical protein